MDDEILRVEVRILKTFYNINYKTIADELGIQQRSFYNWLHGQFDFSSKRKRQLNIFIDRTKKQLKGA